MLESGTTRLELDRTTFESTQEASIRVWFVVFKMRFRVFKAWMSRFRWGPTQLGACLIGRFRVWASVISIVHKTSFIESCSSPEALYFVQYSVFGCLASPGSGGWFWMVVLFGHLGQAWLWWVPGVGRMKDGSLGRLAGRERWKEVRGILQGHFRLTVLFSVQNFNRIGRKGCSWWVLIDQGVRLMSFKRENVILTKYDS